jgi:hypothetical protein
MQTQTAPISSLQVTQTKLSHETSDDLTLRRAAHQSAAAHERSLQDERSADPERFMSQNSVHQKKKVSPNHFSLSPEFSLSVLLSLG